MTNRQKHDTLAALFFLLPNLLGFLAFSLLPIAAALVMSFFQWSPLHGASNFLSSAKFVGLQNFWGAIGIHQHADGGWHMNDQYFWQYLGNTFVLMLGIPFSILGSLGLASLLTRKMRGAPLFITLFFLPSITSGVATYTIWIGLLDPDTGILNAGIHSVASLFGNLANFSVGHGLIGPHSWLADHLLALSTKAGPKWLADTTWAKPALIIMGLWGSIGGYNLILYLAALESVPKDFYEAAELDGAGAFSKFWHITWPMVSPTTFFIFTMSLIEGLQGGFASAYIMTQGGPAGSTTTVSYYIYNAAFSRRFEMGYASAIAWILFLITLVLSAINWRYGRRRVHGEFVT